MFPTRRAVVHSTLALAIAATAARADTLHVPKDFPTIQAAIDAAADGDTIQITKGTYAEAVSVSGKSGLILAAAGKVVIDAVGVAPGISIDDCADISLEGLRFVDGAGDALVITASTLVTISHCRIEGFVGNGISGDASSDVHVDHGTLRDVGGTAIGLPVSDLGNACDGFIVSHCKVLDMPTGSRGLRLVGDNGLLDHTVVTMPDGTGGSFLGDDTTSGSQVLDCRFDGMDFSVLEDSAVLSGNVFIEGNVSIQQDGVDVHDNVFKLSELFFDGDFCTAVNNTCTLQDQSGILLINADACAIVDNLIKGKPHNAIVLTDCSQCQIKGNIVRKASSEGVHLLGTSVSFVDANVIKGCNRGISVDSECDNVSITSTIVKGSLTDGILLSGTNGAIVDNVVLGSHASGVHLAATSSDYTLSTNKSKGSHDFDLLDDSGGASVINPDNDFGTTSP